MVFSSRKSSHEKKSQDFGNLFSFPSYSQKSEDGMCLIFSLVNYIIVWWRERNKSLGQDLSSQFFLSVEYLFTFCSVYLDLFSFSEVIPNCWLEQTLWKHLGRQADVNLFIYRVYCSVLIMRKSMKRKIFRRLNFHLFG